MTHREISKDAAFAIMSDENGKIYIAPDGIENLNQDWSTDSGRIFTPVDPVNAIADASFSYEELSEDDDVASNQQGEAMFAIADNTFNVAFVGTRPPHRPL